ncbi:MAG: hypothetical protein CM15mP32_1760 [Flavobacteriaceae bacterium]|nr:MAG: hypothetical protein CM15mP32_1760 [Flavobacteriaceae bacterium]
MENHSTCRATNFEVERIRKNVLENPIADQRDEFIEKLVTLDKAIDIQIIHLKII